MPMAYCWIRNVPKPFRLPVLTGMTRPKATPSRRERMKRFLRMQSELGPYMDKISEIDVSELDNLKVVQQFDDRAITLMLGNQSYRERYENFLNNQDEIRKRLARRADARSAVEGPHHCGRRSAAAVRPHHRKSSR